MRMIMNDGRRASSWMEEGGEGVQGWMKGNEAGWMEGGGDHENDHE